MAVKKSSKRRPPALPISYLCESDAIEDVLGNCLPVLRFVRSIDLSDPDSTERNSADFRIGRLVVLSTVIDALEYVDALNRYEDQKEVANG